MGAEPARPRSEPRVDAVDAAADPFGAVVFAFVAHRVAEGLHRVGRGHGEAVAMEERVELEEREGAVAAEEREADRAEAPAPQPVGVVDDGREHVTVDGRWASAALPCDRRVELVADVAEPSREGAAPRAEVVELVVDRAHLGDDRVAVELEAKARRAVEAGLHPVQQHPVAEQAVQAVGGGDVHRVVLSRWRVEDAREPGPSRHLPSSPPPVTLTTTLVSIRRRFDANGVGIGVGEAGEGAAR